MKIAFLHTSDIHIPRFTELVTKIDDSIECEHHVRADLLEFALTKGYNNTEAFNREIEKIKNSRPNRIICTCSTLGSDCDKNDDVERIDRPIADWLSKNFSKIGVAFTAKSTKENSINLLLECAKINNKDIEIVEIDCTSSWKYMDSNETGSYIKDIALTLRNLHQNVEVIFLAQSSMEKAIELLTDSPIKIVASSEFGVNALIDKP